MSVLDRRLVTPAARVFTKSFPSGHATVSTITYLTLGLVSPASMTRYALRYFFLASQSCWQ